MITRTLLFLLALPLARAQDLPVKLDGGNTIQLCADCAHREIRAAVTADKFSSEKDEKPQIIEVNLSGVREKAWTEWFQARWEPSTGVPTALILSVSDALKRTGTYNVVLLLRPGLPKLTLQVVQPAAQLEMPEKLLISRTQYLPWSCCEPNEFAFDVRETTGLAGVTDIELFNKQATQGTESVAGNIFLKDPHGVPAGRAATFQYGLGGDYPRGTVDGALKVIAPQLAQPVALPYEVRTKLHPFYLLLSIIAGLALSYWVRTLLQTRILLSQARVQADDILQEVSDHLGDYDDTVGQAMETRVSDLQTAATGTNVATITQGATDLRTAWKAAIDQFNTRSTQATGEFRDLQPVLDIDWIVPVAVSASLAAAKTTATNASNFLQQRKPDRALTALDNTRQTLSNGLHNTGRTWQNDASGLAATIAGATLGIPEPVRVQFAGIMQQAPPELGRIKNDPIPADVASLRRALDDLQTELNGFTDVLERLKSRMQLEWAAISNIWQPVATLPHRDLLEDLGKDFLKLADELGAAAPNARPLLDQLPERLAQLQQKWSQAIVQQIPANHDELGHIRTAIEQRNFLPAVRAMVAAALNAQVVWGGVAHVDQQVPWPAGQAARAESSLTTIFYGANIPSAIPGLPRIRIMQSLQQAQILQSVIVGALTALWAFTSYNQTYDGTWTGLLAPLLGAFLLDVSVEGLKSQVKDKKA